MSLQAIIFDMDGVLVDSEPVHSEAMRVMLAELGIEYTAEDDERFYGCTDREVFRALKAQHGLRAEVHDLAEQWIGRVVDLLPSRAVPLPGVPEILDGLRKNGFRLALASSSSPAIIDTTIRALRLDGAFEFSVSGREVPRGKPAPDIFLETARRLGVPPARCLVVEDSYNGLCAAVAAGIPCVVVPCGATSRQDFSRAAGRLTSLRDLPSWIAGRCSHPESARAADS